MVCGMVEISLSSLNFNWNCMIFFFFFGIYWILFLKSLCCNHLQTQSHDISFNRARGNHQNNTASEVESLLWAPTLHTLLIWFVIFTLQNRKRRIRSKPWEYTLLAALDRPVLPFPVHIHQPRSFPTSSLR